MNWFHPFLIVCYLIISPIREILADDSLTYYHQNPKRIEEISELLTTNHIYNTIIYPANDAPYITILPNGQSRVNRIVRELAYKLKYEFLVKPYEAKRNAYSKVYHSPGKFNGAIVFADNVALQELIHDQGGSTLSHELQHTYSANKKYKSVMYYGTTIEGKTPYTNFPLHPTYEKKLRIDEMKSYAVSIATLNGKLKNVSNMVDGTDELNALKRIFNYSQMGQALSRHINADATWFLTNWNNAQFEIVGHQDTTGIDIFDSSRNCTIALRDGPYSQHDIFWNSRKPTENKELADYMYKRLEIMRDHSEKMIENYKNVETAAKSLLETKDISRMTYLSQMSHQLSESANSRPLNQKIEELWESSFNEIQRVEQESLRTRLYGPNSKYNCLKDTLKQIINP